MKTIPLMASLCLTLYGTNVLALSTAGYTLIPACNPSVTITSLASTTDCFSMSSSVLHAGAPDSYYTWNFGDGTPNETGRTVYHCYASETVAGNTTRTVSLNYFNTDLNCAGSATTTLNVSVVPASPCPNVPPAITLAASTVTVWAGTTIPEIITSFDFGDGTPPSSNAVHTYTACGNYIVRVSQWDMNMPNQICMKYVAVNISCPAAIGIREFPPGHFVSVFPNPTQDLIHIQASEFIDSVTITDPLGKTMVSGTAPNADEAHINITQLPVGTYFITVKLMSGPHKTLRFIKH